MKFVTISSMVAVAAAAADPQITPRAELAARQNSDPAFLGWVSATQTFTDARSCDFPATVSRSGSLAQCCSGSACTFWSSCSAGTLFASQTSLFCDQGYCNTAVLVPSIGASSGQNYLGCWATSLGQNPFTVIADIGSAPVGDKTGAVPASSGASTTRRTSGMSSAAAATTTPAPSAGIPTQSAQSTSNPAQSSGAANAANAATVQPFTGVFGLAAMMFGML